MLFDDIKINDVARSDFEEFLNSTIIGERADFITMQPDNPDLTESYPVKPVELTTEQAIELLQETKKQIWG